MDMMMDSSLGSLPTLIVPDDPVNGAIEKPKTPPPVETDLSRMPPAIVKQKAAAIAVVAEPTAPAAETTKEDEAPPLSSQPDTSPVASLDTVSPPVTEAIAARKALESEAVSGRAADTPAIAQVAPLLSPRGTPRVKSNGDAFEIAFGESEQDQNAADVNANDSNGAGPLSAAASSPTANDNANVKPDQAPADSGSAMATTTAVGSVQAVSSSPPPPPTASMLSSKDYVSMAKRAQALAKLDRLAAGSKPVFGANMQDIGALGIGMQLYFMLTKYLSVIFLVMGVISLPTIVANYYGNGVTDKLVDLLQLAYASLGNQGVSEDIASDPRLCLPKGEIDCNWTTVSTPFTSNPNTVSWIITVGDCVYSVCFLIFCLVFRYKAKQAIELHMTENSTPGKYAVYVRGLPPDTQEQEILNHFNGLYDLTKDDEYFPLWLSCCWGRRRKVNKTLAANKRMAENVFYGDDSSDANPRISWDLQWDQYKTCTPGSNNETRYYIAYTDGIVHDFVFEHPAVVKTPTPKRRIDPRISETSSVTCSTLPCFDQYQIDQGDICETYLESHMLYCLCTDALTTSLDAGDPPGLLYVDVRQHAAHEVGDGGSHGRARVPRVQGAGQLERPERGLRGVPGQGQQDRHPGPERVHGQDRALTGLNAAGALSPRMQAHKPQVIPEFTDFFRKSVPKKYTPDTKLGFAKNDEGELIRRWREETVINGIRREPGEQMRTWEAMQAPVKIYAIEANSKHKLANAELFAAAKRMRTASTALSKIEVVNHVQGDDGVEQQENKKVAQEIQENLMTTEPASAPKPSSSANDPSTVETAGAAGVPPVSARVQSPSVDGSSAAQVQDPIEALASTVDPSPTALPEPETISANASA